MNETATINLQETKLPLAIITIKDGKIEVKTTSKVAGRFAELRIEDDRTNVKVAEEVTIRLMLRLYRDVRLIITRMAFDYGTDYLDGDIVEVIFAYHRNFRYGYNFRYNLRGDVVYAVGAYDYYISKGIYEIGILEFSVKRKHLVVYV